MAGSAERLKSYKTMGLAEEGRRRREEEGVQLRKTKREEQIAKRRNVAEVDAKENQSATGVQETYKDCSISFIVQDLLSANPSTVLMAATKIRKLVARDDPPVTELVESGAIPLFVQFLTHDHQCTLQFESCWVLTNVASGSSLHTRTVVEAGAVPGLARLLRSPFANVKEQVVWALGNIAGDNVQYRDLLLDTGVLEPLLEIVKSPSTELPLLKIGTWTLSNLCRGKNPPQKTEQSMQCLPVLAQLLYKDDVNVLADACWALSFLADGSNKRIQLVIDAGVVLRVVELLMHPVKEVVAPSLRCVGNLLTGDDVQTQVVLNCSVLTALEHLCRSNHDSVQKEACWAVSNIAAGNKVQIQALIDSEIFTLILDVATNAEYKTKKEAIWAVCNALSGGTAVQVTYLVNLGCIQSLCDSLGAQDSRLVITVLQSLDIILKLGKAVMDRHDGVNPYAQLVEEAKGLGQIEALQSHLNESVYKWACRIIETYFDIEEGDDDIAPDQSNERFLFGTNANVPLGGFQL